MSKIVADVMASIRAVASPLADPNTILVSRAAIQAILTGKTWKEPT